MCLFVDAFLCVCVGGYFFCTCVCISKTAFLVFPSYFNIRRIQCPLRKCNIAKKKKMNDNIICEKKGLKNLKRKM